MTTYFAELAHEALLQVRGPDAERFLQGQVTCDLREVSAESARLGAYCNPQGRVICDFLLARPGEDSYLLRLADEIAEHAATVLGKYVVFSKAELSRADDWRVMGLWGAGAATTLKQVAAINQHAALAAACNQGLCAIQLDQDAQLFELWVHNDRRQAVEAALAAAATPADADSWRLLHIERGVARLQAATIDTHLPQALNFDRTGHISFHKGCYTGQEVVARLHYRGKSKRRTHLASAIAVAPPRPGDAIMAAGKAVGEVINAAATPAGDGATRLLVCVAERSLGDTLELDGDAPASLELGTLPYSLEPE